MNSARSIALESIHKSYGANSVLKNIKLTIQEGEFISIVGPSGCGKSTLLKLIAGLEFPDDGHVLFNGQSINHLLPSERNVAMVFQNYALYPHLSVLQNVTLPLEMSRLSFWQRQPILRHLLPSSRHGLKKINEEAMKLIHSLKLESLVQKKPAQISGGQRQRVALARAMVRSPSVFLMDEPLSNLDAQLRVHLRQELVDLHKTLGITFIYVTHDQSEAMTMSDRIALMSRGELLQVGTPQELYDRPQTLEVAQFLGSPSINTLSFDTSSSIKPSALFAQVPSGFKFINGHSLAVRSEHILVDVYQVKFCDFQCVATAKRLENLGPERLLYLELHDEHKTQFVSRLPSSQSVDFSLGQTLLFGFELRHSHHFDANKLRLSDAYASWEQEE
jgi:multiple sugar transport system ATP-binding protein